MRLLMFSLVTPITILLQANPSAGAGFEVVKTTFDEMSQVCPNEGMRQRLLAELKQRPIPADAAITLVAYSDTIEMKLSGWKGKAPCVPWPIPDYLIDHGRISLLRGLSILALLQEANIMPENRPWKVLVDAKDEDLTFEPRLVQVVPRRGTGAGTEHRRVEVRWTTEIGFDSRTASKIAPQIIYIVGPETKAPTSPPQIVLNAPLHELGDPNRRLLRILGLSFLSVGAATVAIGSGLFIGGAVREEDSAHALSRSEANLFQEQAKSYWQSGAWSVGLGAGIALAGIGMVWGSRHGSKPEASVNPSVHKSNF